MFGTLGSHRLDPDKHTSYLNSYGNQNLGSTMNAGGDVPVLSFASTFLAFMDIYRGAPPQQGHCREAGRTCGRRPRTTQLFYEELRRLNTDSAFPYINGHTIDSPKQSETKNKHYI